MIANAVVAALVVALGLWAWLAPAELEAVAELGGQVIVKVLMIE